MEYIFVDYYFQVDATFKFDQVIFPEPSLQGDHLCVSTHRVVKLTHKYYVSIDNGCMG